MSKFSGKCDLYDHICMKDFDIDYFKNARIYLGYSFKNEGENLEIIPGKQIVVETIEDLIPYYPHIISLQYADEYGTVIYLTEKSWVDMEKESLDKLGIEYRMYDYYKKLLEEEKEKYLVVKPQ